MDENFEKNLNTNQNRNQTKNLKKTKNENTTRDVNRKRKTGTKAVGGMKMNNAGVNNSLFENDIIGFRDLRNRISEVIDSVTTNFNVVISGNIKKNHAKNTASIISTTILKDILEIYEFNTKVSKDEVTGQHETIQKEIGIYGCGDTKEEAINALVDLVIDSTDEYFENVDMYARIPEMKQKYPYYLRLRQCQDKEELLKVLNLS
jgi:hypothetical protein